MIKSILSSPQPRKQEQDFPLQCLPGLSVEACSMLANVGIHSTLQLLAKAPDTRRCQTLARSLNLRDQQIRKWSAMADLARVPKVGTQFCGLLLHAGIHSVSQLAQADAGQLHRHILRFQVALMQRKDKCPQLVDVVQWIQQAKRLL